MEELQLSAADLRKVYIKYTFYNRFLFPKFNVHASAVVRASRVTVASCVFSPAFLEAEEKLACYTRIYCSVPLLEKA